METKISLNYKQMSTDYEDRHKNCDNCQNLFRVSPYKNRCMLMDTDINNPIFSIRLNFICDKFKKY